MTTREAGGKSHSLAPARLAADAVVLDVAFVKLPAEDLPSYDEIWNAADEQPLAAELRRELVTNGLRAGIVGQELPAALRQRLDAKETAWEERGEELDAGDADKRGGQWRLQVRTGRRRKILASRTYRTLPVLLSEEGGVRGHQLTEAQCLLALKALSAGRRPREAGADARNRARRIQKRNGSAARER